MQLTSDECDFLIELLQRALPSDVEECEKFFEVDALVIQGKLWDQSEEQTRFRFDDVSFDDVCEVLHR